MAIVTVNTNLQIGYNQRSFAGNNQTTINSTATGLSLPFLAQFTGSLTRLVFYALLSSNITNLEVGIMASNATGDLPSDTFLATPNVFSASSNTATSPFTITLTNAVSVVKGNVYWLTFKPNGSYTGVISIAQNHYGLYSYNGQWRASTRAASVWSRSSLTGSIVTVGDATRWYSVDIPVTPEGPTPVNAVASQDYGVAFTLDANHPAIRVEKISFANSTNNNAGSGNPGMMVICRIYNAAGTLLHTFNTQDTDRFNTTTGTGIAYFWNATTADIWLEPATKYYIMFGFTGTFSNNFQISKYPYSNALSTAGGAYTANYAIRSGGVITETTTELMSFSLEISGIRFDDAGGGAGGYVNASPMFTGGFNG